MILSDTARTVWTGDRDKFMAVVVASQRYRRVLFPIFAFNYEISRIVFQSLEPALAEIKLKWWQEELTDLKSNKLTYKHEILYPLSRVIRENNIPIELFLEMIKARRFDIYNDAHISFEEQVLYIKNIFSSLFEICLRASSQAVTKNSMICVREYGYALGVTNFLLALPALIAAGKRPLYIKKAPANFFTSQMPFQADNSHESIIKIAESGLVSLSNGRQRLKSCNSETRSILFSACTINRTLNKIMVNPELVIKGKAHPSKLYKVIRLLLVRLGGAI